MNSKDSLQTMLSKTQPLNRAAMNLLHSLRVLKLISDTTYANFSERELVKRFIDWNWYCKDDEQILILKF